MQNPKLLIAIGLMVFVASLGWMYMEQRSSFNRPEPAIEPVPAPELVEEAETPPDSGIGSSANPGTKAAPASRPQPSQNRTVRQVPARRDAPPPSGTPVVAADPRAQANEEPADEEPVRGDLSITGRVITQDGAPVPGIALVARGQGPSDAKARKVERRARSDNQGQFEIKGLVDGDYDIRSVATAQYPASGGVFRAGLRSADIVLATNTSGEVSGRVTDAGGVALAGVEVSPIGPDPVRVWTDSGGNFRTQISGIRPGNVYAIQFSLDGFIEERASVRHEQLLSPGGARLDVQLRREGDAASVSGKVQDAGGTAVPGERVLLGSQSLDKRYVTTSLQDGTFTIPNVEPGSDYRVTVHPKGAYESYYEQDLTVQRPSTRLAITLQPLETGRVTGRIVDNNGYAVPDFSITVKSNRSQSATVDLTSDDSGHFTVEDAPAGSLIFATRSQPSFTVSGITLEPGGSVNAELVIDWGDLGFVGRVVDDARNPMSGVDVRLSGQYVGKGLQSHSLRRTVTDADGYFRFTQLGSGPHRLDVVAQGFQGVTQNHDIGAYTGDVEVVLERLGGQGD